MLNKIKKITVGVSAITALLISVANTNAEHINNVDLACKEFTQYYAPGFPFPDADDTFPGITQDCPAGHHSDFPGSHIAEVDLDNHRPAITTSNQSWSLHMHQYYNNSQEEIGVSNLYYQSAIDTFELHLEDDFMANVDLDSIQCSGLPDENNCEGEGDFGVNENGLPFGFEVSFDRANGIITWHFAGNSRGWAKPLVKGENPTLDELSDSAFDTTNPINRMFELGINFNSENIDAEAWSATTTSRVLVKDFVATIPAGEIPEFSDWQAIPHSSNQAGEFSNYYWFPIGTATTIWEKAPSVTEPVCNNLRVDHPEIIYNNTVSRFKTDALDTNGDQFDSNIYYWVDPGDGSFYTTRPEDLPGNPSGTIYEIPRSVDLGSGAINLSTDLLFGDFTPDYSDFNFGFNSVLNSSLAGRLALNPFGSDPFDAIGIDTMIRPGDLPIVDFGDIVAFNNNIEVAPGTPVYFYAQQAGENIIHVEAVDEIATACRRDFDVEPYEICEELLVNYQDPVFEQRISTFEAKSLDTNGDDFTGKITYSVDDGYGAFYLIPPASRPLNDATTIEEFDAAEPIAIPDAGFCGVNNTQLSERSYIKTPISGTNILKLNTTDIINLSTGYATGNFSRLQPLTGTLDTTASYGLTSTLLAFQPIELEIDLSNTEINVLEGIFAPGRTRGYQTLTVNPGTRIYFWANQPGEAVIHVSTGCTTEEGCGRNFDIDPLPQICSELNLTSTPAPPLQTGQTATLNVSPVDQNGEPLPADTQIIWNTDTGGTFTQNGNVSENGTLTLPLSETPVNFSGAAQEGTITVGISPDDPVYSSVCTETIDVGEILSCTNLNSSLTLLGSAAQEANLNRNELYQTSANADYGRAFDNTISYRIDSDYGAFINVADQSPVSPAVIFLRALQSIDQITPLNLIDAFGIGNLGNEMTADEDTNLLFTTYSTTLDSNAEALSIQASGFYNTECQRFVPFIVTGGQCETINIAPLEGIFDPTAPFSVLNITGNFNQHPGSLTVTASEGGLSKFGEENYFATITYSQAEVAASNNSLTVLYRGAETPSGNLVTITVSATGAPGCSDTLTGSVPGEEISCLSLDIVEPDRPWEVNEDDTDSQLFQINVTTDPSGKASELYYTWEIFNDGQFRSNNEQRISGAKGLLNVTVEDFLQDTLVEVWASDSATGPRIPACYDFITARGEEDREPEIEKFVYPENDSDELDDLINIGESSDTQYVTYLVVFKPGDTKSVEIKEEKLSGSRINGSVSGKFEFEAMRINILEEDDATGDTILKTAGYHDDDDDDNYNEHGNNENLEEYEDDYRCEDDSSNLCIVGDFDDVVADFKNGRAIKFRNIDKLGADGKIIIKYQMDNESTIDEDRCEDLTAAQGCGEEFRNEAMFTAYSEDDFDGDETTDSDSARVIVICPFILTRSGGDVFFHDVIDTGIDVAKCSEVKGHEGPGITPTPPRPGETPSTGPGDIPETFSLTLPSHDVCRYSNLGSNIEGYNDVLKHFSSTICELRADVAEIWTEDNINKSIAANVTRISRWGQTLPLATVSNMLSLNGASNKQSGVFTRIGNSLTIGGLGDTVVIEASGDIPAAQTYIVKDADLYIKSNIEYGETDFTNPKTIPSAAFIVIDGNIRIDNNVTKIDGVIMAVDLDGDNDGKIMVDPQDQKTTKRLTINGNLIGDVFNLFKYRIGVGDPTKDEGSVTIHYDERILLNTPPGLNELIDIEQAIVP